MSRSLRVALCDAYPQLRGGAQAELLRLADELRTHGAAVRVVVPGLGPLVERAVATGIETIVVPARRSRLAAVATLPSFWARARHAFGEIDIVHANDHRGIALFGPAGRIAGARVVWHVHANLGGSALNRACAAIAHTIVTPSAAAATALERRIGQRPTVLPGAAPQPKLAWAPARPPTVVTVARLHHAKGVDVLLRAASILTTDRADLRIEIIGDADPHDPAPRRALEQEISALGLDGTVHLLGHQEEPWEVVARASVYAQPSRSETQGLALIAAMSIGVPVVATDLPAFREVVRDGVCGLLVPPDDPPALAAAIARLLDDPDEARRISVAAAASAPPRPSIDSLLTHYETVLDR